MSNASFFALKLNAKETIMQTTQILPAPLKSRVPASVVQKTISEAIAGLFENSAVQCEKHQIGNDTVIVMMANGVCITMHVQEMKGGAV